MLGGPVVQQHIVEFIRGSGVKTDGVLDSTSANGPWTFVVPMGVAQLMVTGCGAGSGGTGGTNASLSGGGGGGGTGMSLMNFPVEVAQGTSLTITVGAKGTGGTLTVTSTAGGDTTISPVVTSVFSDAGTTFKLLGGGGGGAISTGTNGYDGLSGARIRAGSSGGASAGGNIPVDSFVLSATAVPANIFFHAQGGSAGGGASTSGVNGAAGGLVQGSATHTLRWISFSESAGTVPTAGSGGNAGAGTSYGGGGIGGTSLFGEGGNGGGNASGTAQDGTNATGYGAGGGGGGGNGNGGDGSDGYLRITYWSAD